MLSKQEINAKIAEKVMEWEVSFFPTINIYEAYDEDRIPIIIGKEFSPVEKIEDAWKVVEQLRGQRDFTISDALDENNKKVYYANFQYNDSYHMKNYDAFADTAQMAICLAALKVFGIES